MCAQEKIRNAQTMPARSLCSLRSPLIIAKNIKNKTFMIVKLIALVLHFSKSIPKKEYDSFLSRIHQKRFFIR